MRKTKTLFLLLAAMAANACSREPTQIEDRLPPPSLRMTGSNRVLIVGAADTSLEVTAHLFNPTSDHILVGGGPDCPLAFSLIPDSTAERIVDIDAQDCPGTTMTVDVAPGDSITLSRVVPASDLRAFAPGVYDVDVGVASNTGFFGTWAGAVRLPLAPAP